MKYLKNLKFKRQFSHAIKALKGVNSYWEKWFLDVKGKNDLQVIQDIEKKQQDIVFSIGDLQAMIDLLEWRAVIYLKNMDYSNEYDTQMNRIRLFETVAIKQFLQNTYKQSLEEKAKVKATRK